MITAFRVAGFRSFREATIEFEKDLTVLVGPNGAGKSNLAWAMMTTANLLNSGTLTDDSGRERLFGPNRFEELVFRHDPEGMWLFGISASEGNTSGEYVLEVGRQQNGTLGFTKERLVLERTGKRIVVEPDSTNSYRAGNYGLAWPSARSIPSRLMDIDGGEATEVAAWMRKQFPAIVRYAPDPAVLRVADELEPGAIPPYTGTNGSGFVLQLRSLSQQARGPFPRILRRIQETTNGLVEGIGFRTRGRYVELMFALKGIDGDTPGSAISDGILLQLFFSWVIEAGDPKRLMVFIEDLDRSIHPHLHGSMLDWFETMAKERGIQVVLSTHSPDFVNLACAEFPSRLRVVERSDEGGTTVRRIYPATDKTLAKAVEDYREAIGSMWFSGSFGGTPKGSGAAPGSQGGPSGHTYNTSLT